eukprot:COSAG06_NODE_601_length_13893_cov_8.766928_5_plen_75_part_00
MQQQVVTEAWTRAASRARGPPRAWQLTVLVAVDWPRVSASVRVNIHAAMVPGLDLWMVPGLDLFCLCSLGWIWI